MNRIAKAIATVLAAAALGVVGAGTASAAPSAIQAVPVAVSPSAVPAASWPVTLYPEVRPTLSGVRFRFDKDGTRIIASGVGAAVGGVYGGVVGGAIALSIAQEVASQAADHGKCLQATVPWIQRAGYPPFNLETWACTR